jgi:hypothetical protein
MTRKVVFWLRYRQELLAAYDAGELDVALREVAEAALSWADPNVERAWEWIIRLADRAGPVELRERFALVMARDLDTTTSGDEPADAVAFLRSRLEAIALDLRVRKAALDARDILPSVRELIQRQRAEVAIRLRDLYAERARRAGAAATPPSGGV